MGTGINPELQEPTTRQSFEQSDRNPAVMAPDADGGQIAAPAASESRVTLPGAAPSADAGLRDYGDTNEAGSEKDEKA